MILVEVHMLGRVQLPFQQLEHLHLMASEDCFE